MRNGQASAVPVDTAITQPAVSCVDLVSDCEGAYGIGINPSAWVRSFIRKKYHCDLIDDEIDELDDEIDERIEDDDEVDELSEQRIQDKVDKFIHDYYRPLVLRPDVIRASAVFPNKCRNTLLHTIGNRCWIGSYEWALLELMHSGALARNDRFIELREKEERRAQRGKSLKRASRRLYSRIQWGQRKRQFILLNGMLKRLIAEAADPVALQLARRFHPIARENIYRAAAISQRARQLIDVFPALGLVIYCPRKSEYWEKAKDAAQMVERTKAESDYWVHAGSHGGSWAEACSRASLRLSARQPVLLFASKDVAAKTLAQTLRVPKHSYRRSRFRLVDCPERSEDGQPHSARHRVLEGCERLGR